MSWADYTRAARELADLRAADDAAQEERAEIIRVAEKDLEKIDKHLAAQRSNLVNLAKTLRLPPPWFGKVGRSPVTDLPMALHRSADAANAADEMAREAEDAAVRPIFLPDLSPTARNAVLYSGAAAAGWLAQCGLAGLAPENNFSVIAWSLCGIPAFAFFVGYLLVITVGRPRLGGEYPKQVRLGGAICFAGMPLAWLALIALFSIIGI